MWLLSGLFAFFMHIKLSKEGNVGKLHRVRGKLKAKMTTIAEILAFRWRALLWLHRFLV